jgi:hypothetical protein
MGVGRIRLGQSKKIRNVDGTHNQGGEITHFCILKVKLGDKEREQKFYITDLGRDRIILGYTWLVEFDPKINWKDGAVEGQPCQITMANNNVRYHLA